MPKRCILSKLMTSVSLLWKGLGHWRESSQGVLESNPIQVAHARAITLQASQTYPSVDGGQGKLKKVEQHPSISKGPSLFLPKAAFHLLW